LLRLTDSIRVVGLLPCGGLAAKRREFARRKAISAYGPYAIFRERHAWLSDDRIVDSEPARKIMDARAISCPCRAVRVFEPEKIAGAIAWARRESATLRVPVIVEIITERVTNIAMGAEIDAITEFEEVLDLPSAMSLEPETV
jgi:hypothetical protein